MVRSRKQKLLYIFALVIGIVSLSVGFAAFSTTLNISSSASVTPNSDNFSIKFSTNPNYLMEAPVGRVSSSNIFTYSAGTIINGKNPTISNLSATFTKLGDFVEYAVYVRNEGEYTAYLNSVKFLGDIICTAEPGTSENLVQRACESINFAVTVGSTSFNEDSDVSNHPLEANGYENVMLRLEYLSTGTLTDGPFSINFPDVSLVYSSIDQPGYEPPVVEVSELLYSKIKADTLFKGADANVNFGSSPTTGVYVRNGTENHVNPIYYYRGEVTNNNVLFANKCWKIVRTTETGGIKLIYNGTPTSDNKCSANNTMIGYSTFNDNYDTEEDVSYIYSDGTNSTIKQAVDTWYTSNMTSYTDMLEDTVWCNDRSISSVDGNKIYFGAYARNATSGQYQPSLHCPAEYSLTTSATQVTNKLTYPVGLLTADELTLAGMGRSGSTESGYLNNYDYWWTMSPSFFGDDYAYVFRSNDGGYLNSDYVGNGYGVRPAVSLKPGAMVTTGDGTSSKPYIIE